MDESSDKHSSGTPRVDALMADQSRRLESIHDSTGMFEELRDLAEQLERQLDEARGELTAAAVPELQQRTPLDIDLAHMDASHVGQIKAHADLAAIGGNDMAIQPALLSKLCEWLLEEPYTAPLDIQHDMARILQTACDAEEGDPRQLLSEIANIASKHPWPAAPLSARSFTVDGVTVGGSDKKLIAKLEGAEPIDSPQQSYILTPITLSERDQIVAALKLWWWPATQRTGAVSASGKLPK